MNRRLITSVAVFLVGLFLGWYGGVDYLQRGIGAAWAVVCSIVAGWLVWGAPEWTE